MRNLIAGTNRSAFELWFTVVYNLPESLLEIDDFDPKTGFTFQALFDDIAQSEDLIDTPSFIHGVYLFLSELRRILQNTIMGISHAGAGIEPTFQRPTLRFSDALLAAISMTDLIFYSA